MEMIFHSQTNKTHFHKKGCAPSLILKVSVFGTRMWPIELTTFILLTSLTLIKCEADRAVLNEASWVLS